jgi:uncharacterized protein (DUF2336 family)
MRKHIAHDGIGMGRGYVTINRDDIQALIREPSPAARARVAEKICLGFNSGQFSVSEIHLATEIFRLLVRDTEMKVRRVLSDLLKENIHVPHDVIWVLANDKAEVAAPVLQYSFVLTEEDLASIVGATRESVKLRAIAKRASVSQPLARALVGKADRTVAKTLATNRGAHLDEAVLEELLTLHGSERPLLEELVYRGGLPYPLAERLFYKVSGALKKQLTKKYRVSAAQAEDATETARETALLQFLSPWMSQQDIAQLVTSMDKSKRLTDGVVIRSLCIGDLRFFEAAIARRASIPLSNTRILVTDPGPLGFKALYESAKMPEEYYDCVRTLLKLAQDETQYGTVQSVDYCYRMIERITTAGYDKTIAHMDTLMTLISSGMRQGRTVH